MASSSSSSGMRRYHVFPSFHGPDVRRTFLSHLHNHFASKGIRTFKDQEIERGHTIGPELVQAIRESRVSIVVLSKKYASSSWCLDELVEILKCKEDHGQIVMTIFYDVDPSSVRKQKGDFGKTFEKTCEGKTEEEKQRWSQALTHVANIEGEHFLNWANEAEMIQKIATDVSKKLNVTPSRDFEGMVGLEAHLTKLNSLLCLEIDEAKMIGIWGPAGIGKTTIARALYNQLSNSFELECFMGNLKRNGRIIGGDHYESNLSLQNQLLSKVLNQNNIKIHHLGAIKEWLQDQRVLVILDDVDDLEQLEVLAKELSWFGSRSRIIITTEDVKILKAHGIKDIYHVDFPSRKDALEILRLSAFEKSSSWDGFEELAKKVVKLCGNLPLGLCVVGASLRGESKHEWEGQLSRIETNLERKIEDILRVGYDRLLIKNQSLFRHIACFFNKMNVDHVATVLADSNLDFGNGMKTLIDKCLVQISTDGQIVMHYLLQQLGSQIVLEQSDEPGKRQFLVEAGDIRDVLENETGTGSVIGISFNMSTIDELSISKGAFKGMRNLQFLRIYRRSLSGKVTLWIPKYMPRLRLLHWDSYPRKCLPPTFQPERLVELHMQDSNLEKLWGGIQPLTRLKKINLGYSNKLIEIPNLMNATNLETLTLTSCISLEELPSSISNLHKLKKLTASWCIKLRAIPTNINLALLEEVDMRYCSSLRSFPDISSNIKSLRVGNTKIEEVPSSVVGRWSRLERLLMDGISLKRITHVPKSVRKLDLSKSDIKMIPDWVIGLPHLETLSVEDCLKLLSIPGLSPSLKTLNAANCVSLKRVCCSFHNPIRKLTFHNCLKLDEEARKGIIKQLGYKYVCLPGKEIPTEFTHKATGNSITISLETFSASSRFKACLVLSPIQGFPIVDITCHLRSKRSGKSNSIRNFAWLSSDLSADSQSEHLFIFGGDLFHQQNRCDEVDLTMSEVLFEFTYWDNEDKIIECGVQILTEEAEGSSISNVNNFENVHTGRRNWSGEEDRTSILLGVVIILCIFLIIQIFREIGISDARC